MWWAFIACILVLSAVSCNQVVKTAKGTIRGQLLKSRDGRDFYSFTGIPYAKPPVNELRFQAPQPADPWERVLDATKNSEMCIQNNYLFPALKDVIDGQEDCLYLNVYTPNLSGRLPVMFWIHGGGFLSGHSGYGLYGPDYFMDKDVVFVSFNYRLGLFGFISTEDDVLPGNFGLKDQVMALRWVQENIGKFGGDPDSVTVFGESAGAASTGYHLLSPASKGLFHKAILQSGTPMCRWALSVPGVARKRAEAVATIAGCHFNNSEDILNCLKKLSAAHLVQLHDKFIEWLNYPLVSFFPVVESCTDSNPEAFLCNHPITEFKQESFVPIILGFNSGEGGIFASALFNDTALQYPEFLSDFNRCLAIMLMYKHVALPEYWDEIGDRVRKMYLPSGNIDSHSDVVDMLGDGTFLPCVFDMSKKLSSPVYLYLYDYQNEFTFNNLYGGCRKPLGVSHGDEMISLFSLKDIKIPRELNEQDLEVSKLMVDIWVKFASSNLLTVDGKNNGVSWPAFTSVEDSFFLHIDSAHPKVVKNPFLEKYKFWNKLPLWSSLYKSAGRQEKENVKNEL